MDEKVKKEDPKVLLTQGEDGKLKVITGDGKDGTMKTVAPNKENADEFLKIDTRGNAMENFFKKFSAQLKNPSHSGIYAVSAKAVDKIAGFLDKIISINPADKVLEPYRVTPEGKMQELSPGKFQPLDLNKLDWKEVDKLGLSGDALQDSLKAMAYGHKSPGLVEIRMEIDGKQYQTQARLSLEQQSDGSIKINTHPKQEKPDFEKPFMGIVFTQQDKEQLLKNGNGGRVFELQPIAGGEKLPLLVSLDKLTNRFEAVPVIAILIPQTLKNAPLSPEQQKGLQEGKPVLVENMDKRVRPGEEPAGKITRIVQYNASNKNFDFMFTPQQKEQHNQERQAKQGQEAKPLKEQKEKKGQFVGKVWIPKVLLGIKLSDDQFKSLCEGKTIFVKEMDKPQPKGEQKVEATDAKGQKFNAYVKPSQEAGKLKFYQWNPDQAKKQGQEVKPAAGYETQVKVNNEGKTNEATKQSGEPLKKGQTQPTEKQAEKKEQQEQRQSPAKPKKSAGHKM